MSEEIKNNFESKFSYKIETNSRGFNTSLHGYQGVSKEEMKKLIDDVTWANFYSQEHLEEESKNYKKLHGGSI
jgi:hypothetical protein